MSHLCPSHSAVWCQCMQNAIYKKRKSCQTMSRFWFVNSSFVCRVLRLPRGIYNELVECHKMPFQKLTAMLMRPTVLPGPCGHRLKAATSNEGCVLLRIMMENGFYSDESCWTQPIISLKLVMWQIRYPCPLLEWDECLTRQNNFQEICKKIW